MGEEEFSNLKKILYFNTFFGIEDFFFGYGHDIFLGCEVSNCYATKNRGLLSNINKFDAIIFHTFEFNEQTGSSFSPFQ